VATCKTCNGTGGDQCPKCKGRGEISSGFLDMSSSKCPHCNGSGKVKCGVCNGKGSQ